MATVAEPTIKPDATLLDAVDTARSALSAVTEPSELGEHLRVEMVAKHLATHYFACTAPGYRGWEWSVSVARAPGQKHPTVCESALLPSDGALLGPEWLPYAQRLAPGDLGAGDVLPYIAEDPNLEFGFEATGDEDVDRVALFELGLGRVRVLSRTGRAAAAGRWFDGAHGPSADVAVKAPASCRSCGYLLPMAGALRAEFGVCTSEWSPADGAVVALDFGCGAHSEADEPPVRPVAVAETLIDEYAVERVELPSAVGVGGVATAAPDVDPADPTEHGAGQR